MFWKQNRAAVLNVNVAGRAGLAVFFGEYVTHDASGRGQGRQGFGIDLVLDLKGGKSSFERRFVGGVDDGNRPIPLIKPQARPCSVWGCPGRGTGGSHRADIP